MFVTQSKRRANRENSLRSTGPVTEEGKRASSMNAVVHGARAQSQILPGDEPEEVRAFFNAYLQELSPANGVQLSLATRMAGMAWKIERLHRTEQSHMLSQQLHVLKREQREQRFREDQPAPWEPASPETLLACALGDEESTLSRLLDYQLRLERVLLSMYRLYRQLQKDGSTPEDSSTDLHESAPSQEKQEEMQSPDFADCAETLVSDSSSAKSAQSADASLPDSMSDHAWRFVGNDASGTNEAKVNLEKLEVDKPADKLPGR